MTKAERIAIKKAYHTEEINLFNGATLVPIDKFHCAQNEYQLLPSKQESQVLLPGMVILKKYLSP